MKSQTKLWIGVISGLIVLVAVLVAIKAGQIVKMVKAGESLVPPPEPVSSATVERVEWAATREAIGTLVAERGVALGAEVPGTVREIAFESGSQVAKGAVLVKLDTSSEQAQLAAATADAALARISLERAHALRRGEANAQADLDAAQARAKQANAAVASLEATIAKKTIRAPFDGRISIRQVELGQVVVPGTPIASLQSVNPMHADFWVSQRALGELKPGLQVHLHTDAFPDARWDGRITVVNPEVDVATRNVRVRATFPNSDGRLRPGMFVNVEAVSPEKNPVLIIPATAVIFAPHGDSVFAIEQKKDEAGKIQTVARQKFVRLGDRRGDYVAVASGLSAGEQVVSSGAFKLRNGAAVTVDNTLAPDAELAPKPAEQ
ncbi:MAG TPA: efflux RND transporter periplasmic adaptor subunit [Anaeromyxobacter sp.]|nr:efflux RND transporter periplasmic adaptor subunit [Anaeromyxobacter sp.]